MRYPQKIRVEDLENLFTETTQVVILENQISVMKENKETIDDILLTLFLMLDNRQLCHEDYDNLEDARIYLEDEGLI